MLGRHRHAQDQVAGARGIQALPRHALDHVALRGADRGRIAANQRQEQVGHGALRSRLGQGDQSLHE
eukprot:scaffold1291_cov256-Pinguiococcus_pyrenoidosus.AAC.1